MNKLQGKKIVWNGDSICQGTTLRGSWATRISMWNGTRCINYAKGGGTVTANVLYGEDDPRYRHSVCATVDQMYKDHPDADYVVFEGGTNDADLLGSLVRGTRPERVGYIDAEDFSGNYDENTFCGALETVFYKATRYWRGKKIAYIVAQKMGFKTDGYTDDCNNRRDLGEHLVDGRTLGLAEEGFCTAGNRTGDVLCLTVLHQNGNDQERLEYK